MFDEILTEKERLENYDFKLTEILTPQKPTGIFLVGEFSWGDADNDEEEWMSVDSIDELNALMKYFRWLFETFSWNADIDYRRKNGYGKKREEDFYAIAGEEWRLMHLWDGISDWWSYDKIGDIPARLNSYKFILRENGKEYIVEKE